MTETFDKAAWLAEQRKHPMCYRARPGFVRNPLLSYPRNAPCLCGDTGKKWKKCCGPSMPHYIPKDEEAEHWKVLRGEM